MLLPSQCGDYLLIARRSAQADKHTGNTAPTHETHLGMDQSPSAKSQWLIRRRKWRIATAPKIRADDFNYVYCTDFTGVRLVPENRRPFDPE